MKTPNVTESSIFSKLSEIHREAPNETYKALGLFSNTDVALMGNGISVKVNHGTSDRF